MEKESGVDIRFVFVDSVKGGDLEAFAVREARKLRIGQNLDRHGVLFAYDVSRQRLRIEVGPTLQGVFTDRFVGYLMRDHVRTFFAGGNPTVGLRITLFMLHARLRRAALGDQYDPRAAQYITDQRRLATGGGATADSMQNRGQAAGYLNRTASAEARALFVPQLTVEAAYQGYLEWLRRGQIETDVPLFTKATQNYLARIPISPAYAEYLLLMEYGRAFRVLKRGELALLVFTDDPLLAPHFFRRSPQGWQMDIFAEVRDTHEYVGGAFTWSMIPRDDDFTSAFDDEYVTVSYVRRISEGDNRPIPIATTGHQ